MYMHPKISMYMKSSTGIGRGRGRRKTSKVNETPKSDIVYKTRLETDEEYRKRNGRGFHRHVSPEGLKAIAELPDGAEFTMEYIGFGSYGRTRFAMHKTEFSDKRSVSRVNENGIHGRRYAAKTNSQLKNAVGLDNASRIIIHNGGKTLKYVWRDE